MKILVSTLFLISVIAGCSKPESEDTATLEHTRENPAISWFEGSIEEAFRAAREQNKPLFLYWGAVWCPPCNQLKATLFKQPGFISQTRLFVPVYLDGDTERAQLYGDKFAVSGYPTLVIFDPDGTEITRIPGGMELARYENVMQLALRQVKPVKSLVLEIGDPEAKLSEDDCRLLAYYSWDQDNQQVLGEGKAAGTLYRLYNACSDSLPEEKSRLFIAYLHRWLEENKPENETVRSLVVDEEFRQGTLEQLNRILTDPQLVLANVYALRYEDGDIARALTAPGSREREALLANWRNALRIISNTETLSHMERLGTLYAEVSFDKLANDGGISEQLKTQIRERIGKARASIRNKDEQSAVINMARNILYHAQMYDYARLVIAEEVDKAESPYFFMLELADLAQRERRTEDALNWLERAYRESEPGATRFQWGVSYLSGLLEMTPEDETKIQALAIELIRNLGENNDAFYNRNATRLKTMSEALQRWNENGRHNAVIFAVRNQLQTLCSQLQPGSVEYSRCDSFLAGFSG